MNITRMIGTAVLIAAAVFAATTTASRANDGIVLAVVQQSEADGRTGKRVLLQEAAVFSGDQIITGPTGEAQIKFRDDTKLVVGPNSTMVIDAFVFNADDSARQISINAVRGAFRFISGKSAKDAYTITTPTSTIGIRG